MKALGFVWGDAGGLSPRKNKKKLNKMYQERYDDLT